VGSKEGRKEGRKKVLEEEIHRRNGIMDLVWLREQGPCASKPPQLLLGEQ
jgi:hypothetical protein